MNNFIYGKTMETLKYRIDVKLVNNKRLFKIDMKTNLYVTKNI